MRRSGTFGMAAATTVAMEVYLRSSYEPDADEPDADYAAMGIEGIFVIAPATNAYYIYQRGSLDHIGGSLTVSRCQIDFDEIKGLLA